MFKYAQNLKVKLLSKLPASLKYRYWVWRTSKLSLFNAIKYFSEAELLTMLPFSLRTIVDIGANHGDWSQSYMKILGVDCSFYLFEPNPKLFHILKSKFKSNKNLNVYNFAISSSIGTAKFSITDNDVLSSLETINKSVYTDVKNIEYADVNTNTLDNIYMSLITEKNIDLIKIDTQGHEDEILSKAKKTLQNTKSILIEWNIIQGYNTNSNFISTHERLSNAGFNLVHIFNQNRLDGKLFYADALYIHSSILNNKQKDK